VVPRVPQVVKSTTTSVVEGVTSIVRNPAGFVNTLKTGLQNPITTRGGIFGTPPTASGPAGSIPAPGAASGTAVGTDAGVVNALGGTHNCVACAIAGDSTLAGNPASALDLYPGVAIPGGNARITEYAGEAWRTVSGPAAIESELLSAGNGARGIVYGTDGVNAHVWNAVVQDGKVNFIDFQGIGPSGPAAFDPWNSFAFVRTN
jgi:hypothetical protein